MPADGVEQQDGAAAAEGPAPEREPVSAAAPGEAAAGAPEARPQAEDGGEGRALVPVVEPDGRAGAPPPGELPFSVVTVDRDDDIPALCGKIDTAKQLRVVLLAPRGNAVMEREVLGLRLVRRHAAHQGREIVLITRNRRLAQRARAERIPVMASLDGRPGGAIRITVGGRQVTLPRTRQLVGGALAAVVVAAGVLAALAYVPKATVTAYPAMRAVSQPFQVKAGPGTTEVNAAEGTVPAERVDARIVHTFMVPATGRTRVGVASATGKVLFFNRTDAPQSVPAGTVVQTAAGVRFLTTAAVSLPPGADQMAEATVVAAEPGSAGNVPAGAITAVPSFPNGEVTVANLEATTGGQDREVPAVSEADVTALRLMVMPALRELGWQQLTEQYRDTAYIPRETVSVAGMGQESSNANVGEPAEFATLRVEAVVQALAVPHRHLEELAAAVLGPALGDDEMLAPDTVRTEVVGVPQFNRADESVAMQVLAHGRVMRRVSVERLKAEIAWTRPATAAERVRAATASERPVQVDLEPGWLPLLPRAADRITLRFAAGDQ